MKTFFERVGFAVLGVLFGVALPAAAATIYSSGTLLQPGDVTSSHILNGTVVDADISNTAAVSATKVNPGGGANTLLYTTGSTFGTSTALYLDTAARSLLVGSSTPTLNATSSGSIYASGLVQAGTIEATSTLKLRGVSYTPPSADGSNGFSLQTNGAGVLSWVNAGGSSITTTLTAGETITAGDAVLTATTSVPTATHQTCTAAGSDQLFGRTSNDYVKNAQSFLTTVAVNLNSFEFRLKKFGTPTDNVVVEIMGNSANKPDNTAIASTTYNGASLTTSFTVPVINLLSGGSLAASTQYWIVFSRSGALSDTDYYALDAAAASCTGLGLSHYNGSTWVDDAGGDSYHTLKTVPNYGSLYRASALFSYLSTSFLGFATTAGASSTAITVAISGEMSGLSGLTPGIGYYLANATGTIATSPGTINKKVCLGTATTKCILKSDW